MELFTAARRKGLANLLSPAFPTRLIDASGSLTKAQELQDQGYGLIAATTHPTLSDIPRELLALWKEGAFTNSDVTIPIAYYQYLQLKWLADGLSTATSASAHPIVTPDANAKGVNVEELPVGHGNIAFFKAAKQTLANQGVVFVAPNAGRRGELEVPEVKSTEYLLRLAHNAQIPVALLPFGVEVDGATDYDVDLYGGINPRKKYTIYAGDVLTDDEIARRLSQLGGERSEKNPYEGVDEWLFGYIFPSLVTRAYGGLL